MFGSSTVRPGLLIATDRRVVIYAKKLGGYETDSYPYVNVTSIEQGKNMMGHLMTIYATGNKIEVKWIKDTRNLERFISTVRTHLHMRNAYAQQPYQAPPLRVETPLQPPPQSQVEAAARPLPPPAPVTTDVMTQLRTLGELRDAGVLTKKEFASKKAELLKRL